MADIQLNEQLLYNAVSAIFQLNHGNNFPSLKR
jgi:hypothetical protein